MPHAGGSARTFLRWRHSLPPQLRVVPLELAGRGRRTREPRPASLLDAAADLAARVRPGGRYAVLGHSLGGLIAYELTRCLLHDGHRPPEALLVAATRPPHLVSPAGYADLLDLPDEQLLDALVAAGTVPGTLRQGSMWQPFVQIMRGDMALLAGYRPALPQRLPVGLHAWYGTDDPTTPAAVMRGWRRYTAGSCTLSAVAGGHFFVYADPARLLAPLVTPVAA